MTTEIIFVFGLIAITAALMASNRVRYDIVALLVVLALMLSGVLSVGEALSGFGSPVVILVAALLVVGEMLDRTGVARAIGDLIVEPGRYRFMDFVKVGAPLLLLTYLVTVLLAPIIFPFGAFEWPVDPALQKAIP